MLNNFYDHHHINKATKSRLLTTTTTTTTIHIRCTHTPTVLSLYSTFVLGFITHFALLFNMGGPFAHSRLPNHLLSAKRCYKEHTKYWNTFYFTFAHVFSWFLFISPPNTMKNSFLQFVAKKSNINEPFSIAITLVVAVAFAIVFVFVLYY